MKPSIITTSSGVRVYKDWRDNIIVDRDNEVLTQKANLPREQYGVGLAKGCSRLGSENSEDAVTWNFFRTLESVGDLAELLAAPLQLRATTGTAKALYWTLDPTTGTTDPSLKKLLDAMEPWGADGRKQQTESDVIVVLPSAVVVVESKLGAAGKSAKAWCRAKPGIPRDYADYVSASGLGCFKPSFDFERDGQRFYQLMRNWILTNAFARERKSVGYLAAIVNARNTNREGTSRADEFAEFKTHVEGAERCVLLDWQSLWQAIPQSTTAALREWTQSVKALKLT